MGLDEIANWVPTIVGVRGVAGGDQSVVTTSCSAVASAAIAAFQL